MKVKELMEWLKDKPDDFEVVLLIDEGPQCDYPLTDIALSSLQEKVFLIYEDQP